MCVCVCARVFYTGESVRWPKPPNNTATVVTIRLRAPDGFIPLSQPQPRPWPARRSSSRRCALLGAALLGAWAGGGVLLPLQVSEPPLAIYLPPQGRSQLVQHAVDLAASKGRLQALLLEHAAVEGLTELPVDACRGSHRRGRGGWDKQGGGARRSHPHIQGHAVHGLKLAHLCRWAACRMRGAASSHRCCCW